MKYLFTLLLCLAIITSFAQKPNVDSLINVAENSTDQVEQVRAMLNLTSHYRRADLKEHKKWANKAYKLAQKAGNGLMLRRSESVMGEVYKVEAKYDLAIEYYEKAMHHAEEANDSLSLASTAANVAGIYRLMGKYKDAVEYYTESISIAKAMGTTALPELAGGYNGMGIVYFYTNNVDKTLEYFEKAIEIHRKLGDRDSEGKLMNNIGIIYRNMGKTEKALEYYQQSAKIWEEQGLENNLAVNYHNIGTLYINMKSYEKAKDYFQKSLDIRTRANDKRGMAETMLAMGGYYSRTQKYDKAIVIIKEGIAIAEEIDLLETVKTGYVELATVYQRKNDFKNALEMYVRYSDLKDTLLTKANTEAAKNFELELQEKKIELLTKEKTILMKESELRKAEANEANALAKKRKAINDKAALESERKNAIIMGSVIALLLAGVLLFVVFRANRQKQKVNLLLEDRNKEITNQKTIIEEKNADITASIAYAKNLQDAILPESQEIAKYLPQHFIFWQPRDIVSGDFYWFHAKGQKVFIAAADCTGHGVPGAFVSMTCHNALNNVIIDKNINDPGEILRNVHQQVLQVFRKKGALSQANDGMDIGLCSVDLTTRELEFSGAMNSLVIIRGEEVMETKGDRRGIGGKTDPNFEFTTKVIQTQQGDWVYLFSDGFQDQFGGDKNKKFMVKNFKRLLAKIATETPEKQSDILQQTLTDWEGNHERVDDVLVLGFAV